jgi:hypothetical protein
MNMARYQTFAMLVFACVLGATGFAWSARAQTDTDQTSVLEAKITALEAIIVQLHTSDAARIAELEGRVETLEFNSVASGTSSNSPHADLSGTYAVSCKSLYFGGIGDVTLDVDSLGNVSAMLTSFNGSCDISPGF